jgi:hypothetical protein
VGTTGDIPAEAAVLRSNDAVCPNAGHYHRVRAIVSRSMIGTGKDFVRTQQKRGTATSGRSGKTGLTTVAAWEGAGV